MTQLRRFHDVAFANQLEPVRDVVVYWTLPLAVGVTTFQAAVRLMGGFLGLEGLVDFNKVFRAHDHRLFGRVLARHITELEIVR